MNVINNRSVESSRMLIVMRDMHIQPEQIQHGEDTHTEAIMTELLDLIIVHDTYCFTTFHVKDNIRPPYGIM